MYNLIMACKIITKQFKNYNQQLNTQTHFLNT